MVASELELGCPLDQSLTLTAAFSETWGLRETWRRVAHALANGARRGRHGRMRWMRTPINPSLVRHLLYRARIPYWSAEGRAGQFRIETGGRWRWLSAEFAPSARQLALTLYFDPMVTAA